MITKTEDTFTLRLYLSGPIDIDKQVMRKNCYEEGLCVTIEPTTFIYTGGEEEGYVVGFVNYPRFPTSADALMRRARKVMAELLDATHQHSALLVSPKVTEWWTRRSEPAE
jgi:hypothetical protein